jgi:beta-lactamase superfamily II metal-dependent hydrolase
MKCRFSRALGEKVETNDNSVAILLTYSTARILLAGDPETRDEYIASGSYTRP